MEKKNSDLIKQCDTNYGVCSCGAIHTGATCIPGCIKTGKHDTCQTAPKSITGLHDIAPVKDETNPKDLVGVKKPRLSLVPASSSIYQALAMENGAMKYGPFNWREKKVRASIYIEAAKRHLDSWYDSREEVASDSGVPHLGHALACIGIIVDAFENGNLMDDRPIAGPAAKLIKKWTKK